MTKIYNNFSDLVGKTPLVKLSNLTKALDLNADIIAKVESFNPGGSVKDRIAKAMIESAEREGKIDKNTQIVEPTSGNTGIGLAAICASKGYSLTLTMPETMSVERRAILKAYGANLVLTDGKLGMKGAIAKAEELVAASENSFMPSQFANQANPEVHFATTGPEIWADSGENVDIFVAGIGTGGTITGVGRFLKSKNPNIKIVAVEPADSPVLSGEAPGPHKIQGIGAGFVPEVLDTKIYDEIVKISNDEAFNYAKKCATVEGLLVGISSGAALCAATKIAMLEENKGKTIVVVLPDTGERYLSMLVEN